VVRETADRRAALLSVGHAAGVMGLDVVGFAPSGVPGPKGNRETFIHCALEGTAIEGLEAAALEVEP
jgi:23S rRNA (cytidine1920-2'-O)/16S rRNA (cytidine1409-2'-O)-methyltransferase